MTGAQQRRAAAAARSLDRGWDMATEAEDESLAEIEDEVRRRLTDVLPSVIIDGRPTFTNRDFNPHGLSSAHYGVEADELLELCRRAESLRTKRGVLDEKSPSALYLAACAEAADLTNHQRLGPRRLAQRLLQ